MTTRLRTPRWSSGFSALLLFLGTVVALLSLSASASAVEAATAGKHKLLLKSSMLASMMSKEVLQRRRHQDRQLLETLSMADSPCSGPPTIDRDTCIGKTSADCMWIETDSKNLCLPCKLGDATPIPCPPIDSVFAMKKVKDCQMKCSHQLVITKDSPCTDVVGGTVTPDQCFSKGTSVLSACMWSQYTR